MNFNHPFWLYVLPLVLIGLGLLLYRTGKARQRFLEAFTSSQLASRLLVAYSPVMRTIKNGFLILGIIMILLALARPQWGFQYREVKSKGIDVLFALDASKSMLAEDIKPNRLDRAKLAILDFVDQLDGDRVGLIAFAGGAFLQCPPTLDYNAFKLSLDAVDTNVIAQGGTDIAAAISEARSSFNKDSAYKFLILITDGEDLEGSGLKRAIRAKDEGLKIYTVGVGTEEGDLIPFTDSKGRRDYVRDEKGNVVRSRLDEKSLMRVAGATEGFYVPLGPTGEGLREVYDEALGSIPKQDIGSKLQKLPLERFQWPLGIALFLLAFEPLLSTRKFSFYKKRRQVVAPLILFVLIISLGYRCEASPQDAYKEYLAGDYGKAYILYDESSRGDVEDKRLQYNTGASAYKAGQYDAAEAAFCKTLKTSDLGLQEKSFYNLGNTLFQQGEQGLEKQKKDETIKRWEEALEHYQSALDLNPDHADAAHNKAYVEKRLEELKKQQQEDQQQNQEKDQEKKDDQQQSSQDQQSSGDKKEDQQQSSESNAQDQQKGSQNQPDSQPSSQDQSGNKNPSDQSPRQGDDQQSNTQDQSSHSQSGEDEAARSQERPGESSQAQGQQAEDTEAMTRYEALKLLDSLKDSEKKLPVNSFGSQPSAHENKPKKDW